MTRIMLVASLLVFCIFATSTRADDMVFSTGSPDGLIATASRPSSAGKMEIETADDFFLSQATSITGGTFTGLLPTGASLSDITSVTIEFYRIFPLDSTVPPDGRVPTRDNSPSDAALNSRDSGSGELTFSANLLNSSFTAANSVLNGIHPLPTVFTGGEGPITGQEVQLSFSITSDMLAAGHYFFVPQVELSTGDFFWLSAPKPISGPGTTPFPPGVADLQTWTRNEDLQPDWLRVGTDITHQGPFNASFSLNGEPVPEPCTLLLTGAGLLGLILRRKTTDSQQR
jgi:PEP-CTERM motif